MSLRINSFKQAAFWSTTINAFSQGLALLFSILMAKYFGAQESTDILYFCLGIFVLLGGLLQVVNVSVLIPETMRRRHQVSEQDAMAFINRFFAVFVLMIGAVTVLSLSNPVLALSAISRFDIAAIERNMRLAQWLLLSFPLQMTAQLLLDILVSYKFLMLPALLSCVNRLINILFVVVFYRRFGVVSVAMGMVVGFSLQVALNAFLLRRKIHWKLSAWRTRITRQTYWNILWVELGTLSGVLASYLPIYLFSGFAAGVVTILNYARRMSLMPVELLTVQVSSVIAVKFNEQAAMRDFAGMGKSFGWLQRQQIFFLTPLAFLLGIAGYPIISLLYGHGAFDANAVAQTARLFSVLMLMLPFLSVDNAIARLFVAHQEVALGTRYQVMGSILNAVLIFVFVKWKGTMGFAVAMLLTRLLYLLILSAIFSKRFRPITLWPTTRSILLTFAYCGVLACGALWLASSPFFVTLAASWRGVLAAGIFIAGYLASLVVCPPDRLARNEAITLGVELWARIRHIHSKWTETVPS